MQLSLNFCQQNQIVLATENDCLRLFFVDTLNTNAPSISILSEITRLVNEPFELVAVSKPLLEEKIQKFYDNSNTVAQIAFENIEEESLESLVNALDSTQDLLAGNDDAPVTRLINVLISQAVREQASDIHIEVYEFRMRVRFRVDGVLREVLQPNHALASRIIARIKVMAKLDIAEKRLPQDGRISTRMGEKSIDIRVSSIPAAQSEKIVLRLLEKQVSKLDLTNLGLPKNLYQELDVLIHKTNGIVLVTGPTGSGKTTTLYAALTQLNDFKKNIMTVEDPIEYDLDGINQTMVNAKVDITFAKSLRAILRQDPDIIMIGEIRDVQTAEIAIQSSLTGHLVFSTLHTNTAIGAISRLRDMGVEPFLLASSLSGVLAQRLIRLLCEQCKQEYQPSAEVWEHNFGKHKPSEIYQEIGCAACNYSGYSNRIGIYELVTVDMVLKKMIHDEDSEANMTAYHKQNHRTLRNNALDLVLSGKTSLDEVYRVIN